MHDYDSSIAEQSAAAALLLSLAFLVGCSSDNPTPPSRLAGNAVSGSSAMMTSTAGTGTGMAAALPAAEQPGLAGSTGLIIDSGAPADAKAGCAATSVTAPAPNNPMVDIVWVVDASGSMLDEQIKIGANLTEFANKITMSNIDVHIVMMTTSAAIPV